MVMGLDTGKKFVVGLLGLVVIGVIFMIILNSLGNTTIVTADPNGSGRIIGNATAGATDFFGNSGTWFSLLSIVIIILIIVVVIFVVNRLGKGGNSL